jgi:hypothetical protein
LLCVIIISFCGFSKKKAVTSLAIPFGGSVLFLQSFAIDNYFYKIVKKCKKKLARAIQMKHLNLRVTVKPHAGSQPQLRHKVLLAHGEEALAYDNWQVIRK